MDNQLKSTLVEILTKCPSSKELKGGLFDKGIAAVIASSNDTWGWYNCYCDKIEGMLTEKGYGFLYAFERMPQDYPWITMFFGKGDIMQPCKDIIEEAVGDDNRIVLESGRFKDVCEEYNEAYTDELSQQLLRYSDTFLTINEV